MSINKFVFYASYYIGNPCQDQLVPENTIPISVSPNLFGNEDPCGKTLKIDTNTTTIFGKVIGFCPITGKNTYINIRNGEIMHQKCYFNNSINFLGDEGYSFMERNFRTDIYYFVGNFLV